MGRRAALQRRSIAQFKLIIEGLNTDAEAIERFSFRIENDGERGRTRTYDPCLKRALLYQLSYAPAPQCEPRT
jgi:hypothetical protein